MTSAFDQRIVQLSIQIQDQTYTFDGLDIRARGQKFWSSQMSQCSAIISNLTKEQRQDILTRASPIQRAGDLHPIRMTLDVGRQSTGTFRLFEGDVFQGGVTQPPDIGITLNSLTNNFIKAQTVSNTQPASAELESIAATVAADNGLTLDFQATPRTIENYSFTGSPDQEIVKLNQMGNIIAAVDGKTLIVCDADKPRGKSTRLINANTGMVGVPQPTSQGCVVQLMIDNTVQIGGEVQVESIINPGVNGNYYIRRMDFEIANRDDPFWYTLECVSPSFYTAATQ
jgi:hypothetical protein